MDTGSNRLLVAVNVESIAEVKVLDVRLSGRVRPIERASDYGGDAAAARIGSAAPSTTSNATPTGTPTPRRTSSTAIPRRSRSSANGAIRLADRSASPAAETSCFSSTATNISRGRQEQRGRVTGCPRCSSGAGDFSQTTRQQRQSVPASSATRRSRARCNATSHAALLRRTAASLGRIPKDRLYQIGLSILNMFPMPTGTAAPGVAYNFEITRPIGKPARVSAGHPPRLPGGEQLARDVQDDQLVAAQADRARIDPRVQRHPDAESSRRHDGDHPQLQPERDDLSRGHLRPREQ